jgi:hypothetical protein
MKAPTGREGGIWSALQRSEVVEVFIHFLQGLHNLCQLGVQKAQAVPVKF